MKFPFWCFAMILLLLFLNSCSVPKQQLIGGSCATNEECITYKCANGFCDFSDEGQYCQSSSYCRGDLICKEFKCTEQGLFCELRDISSVFKIVGLIMLLVLILGTFYPLPTSVFGASITHGGTRVVGYVLIMAIALAVGFYLSSSCF